MFKKSLYLLTCLALSSNLVGSQSQAKTPEFQTIPVIKAVNDTMGAARLYKSEQPSSSHIYNKPLAFYKGGYNNTVLLLPHYKTYQQTNEASCGPAALVMLLNYYDIHDVSEDQLYHEMDVRYLDNPKPDGSYGSSTSMMAEALRSRGFIIKTSKDTEDQDGYSFPDITSFHTFVKDNLQKGNPILVENMEWGGHWLTIIGYDDLGTQTPIDDMLIFADSYDVSDQHQDGYSTRNSYRYFSEWVDALVMPKDQRIQQYIAIEQAPTSR